MQEFIDTVNFREFSLPKSLLTTDMILSKVIGSIIQVTVEAPCSDYRTEK